ncbi:MAG: hypothetical protein IJD17_04715 [Clostridia bacterium]|nr:hypothetical protein [Clostridia bacterium]
MKKNTMMRVASALLVAVLLTTCAISGTFAKYVTSADATDSARVAKFGVEVTANGSTFAEAYDSNNNEVATVVSSSWDLAIDDSEDNVVAPGTKGDMVSMVLKGKPEVDVKVSYVADIEISDNWVEDVEGDNDPDFYFPIIVTINGAAYSAEGTGCATADAFEAYLEAKIAEYSKEYNANTDLATVGADALDISWEWPFEAGNDKEDTWLGDQAAADNAATFSIAVTTTVTQID